MARQSIEKDTDILVNKMLENAGISATPDTSGIKEVDDILETASKKGTGNIGKPDFLALVGSGVTKNTLLVIEDKKDVDKHIKLKNDVISDNLKDVEKYAVNGAVYYGIHIATRLSETSPIKRIIAIGCSGDSKNLRISPYYINERGEYKELPEVSTFTSFSDKNIDDYYTKEILEEKTDTEKELAEILKDAANLHEDLRNYGNLKDVDKPLVVSGILLALNEIEKGSFDIEKLNGDDIDTDGNKIYEAIGKNLDRANVGPQAKKDKLLAQFSIIKNSAKLNEINTTLNKTPLRHYAEFLYENIFKAIKYSSSSEDYLGRFYGEFMSYSGGDGQTLGIVLTPKHITELFCDLLNLKPDDRVFDPCCGTGGFLVAAMHKMLSLATSDTQEKNIKKEQLHGIELQDYMFTIATTNMILRGDGKSNLLNEDFLRLSANVLQAQKHCTVGMINPPYSQGSTDNQDLYEICFVNHLLDSLSEGAKCAAIIPQSSMTGKTKTEQNIKRKILSKHTLEGVITLNPNTFYGVGVMPCIAIFTAHEKHPVDKEVKFINFADDGYEVSPHIGLLATEKAVDKKQHLLDVWFDKTESDTSFCVKSTIEADDEWLHSYFYFNDDIPTDDDFSKAISDYLSFEFAMIMQDREYLFKEEEVDDNVKS